MCQYCDMPVLKPEGDKEQCDIPKKLCFKIVEHIS